MNAAPPSPSGARSHSPPPRSSLGRGFFTRLSAAHWTLYFLAWVVGLVVLGATLFALLFPVGGWLLGSERTSLALLRRGAGFGGFYFLIWAPAIALCACVMRAYRRRHPNAEKIP
jgi:NADH:ubiquinone oxidoreductase subunit H